MSPTRHTDDPARVLRTALSVNAVATAATGALFLLGADALYAPLGLESARPLAVVGGLFLAFGAWVWSVARRRPLSSPLGRAVFALDAAYVAASIVFLLAFPRALSPLGWWLVIGLAEVVTGFALAELVGLRRITRGAATA